MRCTVSKREGRRAAGLGAARTRKQAKGAALSGIFGRAAKELAKARPTRA